MNHTQNRKPHSVGDIHACLLADAPEEWQQNTGSHESDLDEMTKALWPSLFYEHYSILQAQACCPWYEKQFLG